MGLIANSKHGLCSICGQTSSCRKRGKELICTQCCKTIDTKKQLAKANEKQKVRSLGTYQKEEGIVDSIQELTMDLDRVISRYIRLRDMEKDGKITCYTCDNRVKWEKAHAMHFCNRQHLGTRFLLQNLRSGCYDCNVTQRGNLIEYAKRLNKENNGLAEWLTEQSRQVISPTRQELKEILFDFHQKLRLVETKLK